MTANAAPPTSQDSGVLSRTAYLRQLVCANQGYLAQYLLMAASMHQRLKQAFGAVANQPGQTDAQAMKAAREAYEDLILFLNVSLERAVASNFEHIQRSLVGGRNIPAPRLALVGPVDSAGEKALFLFRNPIIREFSGEEFETKRSTSIAWVNETGEHYLCADLPAALKKGEYRNERLKAPNAAERCDVNTLSSLEDPAWCDLWDGGPPLSCYKSNLVIPVTFANSPNLLKKDELDGVGAAVLDMKNKILAYLCMDHVSPEFFTDYAVDIGYCSADMISLYLATRYQYTKYSETFFRATELFASDPS